MCEPTSDSSFGFHESFITASGNVCAFAVVPSLIDSCLINACPDENRCALHLSQSQEQRQTQIASHELAEVFSNPHSNAWAQGALENGDICNGKSATLTIGQNVWTVQRIYSKWHDMNTNGSTYCVAEVPEPLPSLLPEKK